MTETPLLSHEANQLLEPPELPELPVDCGVEKERTWGVVMCGRRCTRRRVFLLVFSGIMLPGLAVLAVYLLWYASFAPSKASSHINFKLALYNVTCSDFDDDTVYTSTSCASQDYGFCYEGESTGATCVDGAGEGDDDEIVACFDTCTNGTACFDWCGDACGESWGAWCVWGVWANLETSCAGNYTPTSPALRRRALSEWNWGTVCAYHARCEACTDDESTCDDVYHKYFYYDPDKTSYSGNEPAAAALEASVFETWCDKYNYTYVAR